MRSFGASPEASDFCGQPALSAVDVCRVADANAKQQGKTGVMRMTLARNKDGA
jgi:hypothetical protein